MNGQYKVRISTFTEARNHPILGMLFLPLFSSVLNESPPWSLLLLGEIIVVSMIMKTLSLPHLYYQLEFFSYTYVFHSILPQYFFPSFPHLQFQREFSAILRYFNLFLFTNFPLTSSFLFSTLIFLLPLRITTSSSALLLVSIHRGVSALKF